MTTDRRPPDAAPAASPAPEPPRIATPDPWGDLRAHTTARLALGRAGSSMPTDELLRFGFAHAMARDAVHLQLDVDALCRQIEDDGCQALAVHSAAADRAAYLLRPDLGRRLDDASVERLAAQAALPCDLLIVVGDGLSSMAVERNARPMIAALRAQAPAGWRLGPIVVASQARVALGDEIGQLLHAPMVAMLIGERPGLSSPDSLGLYLTWQPQVGRSDAERNCISNIRPAGSSYADAARRCWWLAAEARRLKLTGVQLKDRSDDTLLRGAAAPEALPTELATPPPQPTGEPPSG
ncbi:ethanolamine ammonia-lyase subunit EutC [Aquincola sp. MAHUQ-54]|uniref:Ethanolamine ammonia-lyase small subunit n=1 Tax=Aquincola agrisoli TaxID=3119538 RepID=A0AAW9QM64_9BURK